MMADLKPEPDRNVSGSAASHSKDASSDPTPFDYDMDSAIDMRVVVALERIADFLDRIQLPKWLQKS
jgi:hypothetical protein